VFLLFARGYYALGDSRTPGLASVACAAVGVGVMAAGSLADGAARVFVLGLGHTVTYGLGVAVLGVGLSRRTGGRLWPAALGRVVAVSTLAGLAAWWASEVLLDAESGRIVTLAVLGALGLAGAGIVLGGYRLLGVRAALSERTAAGTGAGDEAASPSGSAGGPVL
jgi:peptidoglycan biosynthesis protein MviN/MurJ (putative lipid II flippase)